jgi:hypothetical protein
VRSKWEALLSSGNSFFPPAFSLQLQTMGAAILFPRGLRAQSREFSLKHRVMFGESAHQREVILDGNKI